MKELEERVYQELIVALLGVTFPYDAQGNFDPDAEKIAAILAPIFIKIFEDYFKQSGKRGGTTTKQRHPNHLKEISKKGVEARKKKILA